MTPSPLPSRRAGFTLLEVVVAVAILALSLGAVMRIFGTGLRSLEAAERHTIATLHAQSKLDEMGIEEPLAAGETAGSFERGYRWRASVSPYSEPDFEADAATGMTAYQVSVTVTWDEGEVALTTLRLAVEP
jgi:general secretion pathway protein I